MLWVSCRGVVQRRTTTYVVRPRHSRFADNHGSLGGSFATPSRRIVCRSSRINLGWTASRIFADVCRRVTGLLRTTGTILIGQGIDRPGQARAQHVPWNSTLTRNILLVRCLTESAETLPRTVNERPSGLDPQPSLPHPRLPPFRMKAADIRMDGLPSHPRPPWLRPTPFCVDQSGNLSARSIARKRGSLRRGSMSGSIFSQRSPATRSRQAASSDLSA
jgi:hypothetical protein